VHATEYLTFETPHRRDYVNITDRVEAFVLDFDGDLYGEALGVEFVERLRGMEKFDDVDALVAQMTEDVVRTRSVID